MSFGEGVRITAEDMASRPFLPGGMWFFFACFGAGTPHRSAYHHWLAALRDIGLYGRNIDAVLKSLPGEKEPPFVAALPQAALANPNGPLAVMGHVDLAWTFSFQDVGTTNKYRSDARFQDIFRTIVAGKRAGAGYAKLQSVFKEASVDLTTLYDKEARTKTRGGEVTEDRARKTQKATLWMLRQDLSAYVLLGDPAARLNIEGSLAERARPKVPEIHAPKLDTARVEEAIFAKLDDEALGELASACGVSREELDQWILEYKTGGRAAVAGLAESA
jgi:hypothetical protein